MMKSSRAAHYTLMISLVHHRTTSVFLSTATRLAATRNAAGAFHDPGHSITATTARATATATTIATPTTIATRHFAEKQASTSSSSSSSSTTKAKQKKRKKRSKAKQRQKDREANERRERYRKLKRQKNLHPAAKWKRILSACDFWFSRNNLLEDSFVRDTIQQHNGYIPISTLLTFPKFHHWTDAQLLVNAFESTEGVKRYQITYDPKEWNKQELLKQQKPQRQQQRQQRNKKNKESKSSDAKLPISAQTTVEVDNDTLLPSSAIEDEEDAAWASREQTLAEIELSLEEDSIRRLLVGDSDPDATDIANPMGEPESPSINDDSNTHEFTIAPTANAVFDKPASNLLENAAVRHRKISLDTIELIEQEIRESYVSAYEDGKYHDSYGYDPYNDLWSDEWAGMEEEEEEAIIERPKQLQLYKTNRKVVVLRGAKGLSNFCSELVESARAHAARNENDPNACAIGFDVEYCTQELDIRNTLPAMLQLASPSDSGPVGLIWLDKFPNHGRDILNGSSNNKDYESLTSLLQDAKVLKVGVGAEADARHLASWWGVSESQYAPNLISGVVNMDALDEGDYSHDAAFVYGMNLSEMVRSVLQRKLPKLKHKHSAKDKARKRQGKSTLTSHWRREELTPRMKEYAAHDATSSVDVWNALHGFQG